MEFTCKSFQNRSYKIYLERDVLEQLDSILQSHQLTGSIFVVSDQTVFRIHGKKLLKCLKNYTVYPIIVPPGEPSKSLKNWNKIQDTLSDKGADRRSVVIAFGGGVIGDLAGFAASTYMRGLAFIQIPTTLLSQSDSSIGAKVAVNHTKAKNLIGSFYQPRFVLTDPSLLTTLPKREFAAGLGEAIKYGVIADLELFETLYENMEMITARNHGLLTRLLTRCIAIKIKVVEEDERETGLRKILNFGHTIGHALEQATNFSRLRHGEAVAWGMLAAGWLALERRMWDSGEFEKLKSILFRAGCLYPMGKLNPKKVFDALKHDKKKTGDTLNFILPERTGKVTVVSDIKKEEVAKALRFIFQLKPPKLRSAK